MTGEIWKPVPGFDGYEVSDLGRFRSHRPRRHEVLLRPRIIATRIRPNGYLNISFRANGKRRPRLAHRVVAEAFLGPCPDGLEVSHENGDRTDNRLANLQYRSRMENNRLKVKHGTQRPRMSVTCKWGHAFTESNTYVDKRGYRHCKTCKVDRNRFYRAREVAP